MYEALITGLRLVRALVLFALVCAAAAPAAEVANTGSGGASHQVNVNWHGRPDGAPREVTVLARSGSDADVVLRRTGAPGLRVRLPDGAWTVTLEGSTIWAPSEYVISGAGPEVVLDAWPAAKLVARVTSGGESGPIDEVLFGFRSVKVGESKAQGRFSVPLASGALEVIVPATILDIQLLARGHAVAYLWDVAVTGTHAQDLGEIRLPHAAAVAGWVELANGDPPPNETTIEVAPVGPPGVARSGVPRTTAATSRGFFQITGLTADRYAIRARAGDRRSAPVEVLVPAGEEATLDQPLVLAPPQALSLEVDPPIGLDGAPWRIRVAALRGGGATAVVYEGTMPEGGTWESEPLPVGAYILTLLGPDGSSVWHKRVELSADNSAFQATLSPTEVEGRLTLGERPLAARLRFHRRLKGGEALSESGTDGRFTATVPELGLWSVDVESSEPAVRRRIAEVEVNSSNAKDIHLRLPGTSVRGLVVDSQKRPVRGMVRALPQGAAAEAVEALSASDGTFALEGLTAGRITLVAETDGASVRSSIPVEVDLAAQANAEGVVLVLGDSGRLRGRVVADGSPLPGVEVLVISIPSAGYATPVRTDAAGAFETEITGGARQVAIIATTPGFAMHLSRQPVGESDLTVTMQRESGTLLLENRRAEDLLSTYLVREDGGYVGAGGLVRWRIAQGLAPPVDASLVEVPAMPPGRYSACVGNPLAILSAAPATPARARCASGELVPYGELRLAVP